MDLIIKKNNIGGVFVGIICTVIVSCFYFPFGLNFIPESINSKLVLAVFGVLFFVKDSISAKSIVFSGTYVPSFLMAFIFSIICFLSTDINYTGDYTYATYFISFFVWLFAAYSCVWIMKVFYRRVDFDLIVYYLTIVCVSQCILSLLIDNIPSIKLIVDTYISQAPVIDNSTLQKIDRLYGIGAALDPAGTRFAIVLIAIAAVISQNLDNEEKMGENHFLWVSFLIIAVIGNMISRTTIMGVPIGLGLIFVQSRFYKSTMTLTKMRQFAFMIGLLLVCLVTVVYYYNTDPSIRSLLRYGFEGFFNWWEIGEWKTSSTDLLFNAWIWPEDTQGWIIGYGLFDNWVFGTDIGYCRFVLYSGIIGMICFSLFFVFNAYVGFVKFPQYKLFFFMLLCLSFIIWIKVSTDLFLIYALFFVIDKPVNNENSL